MFKIKNTMKIKFLLISVLVISVSDVEAIFGTGALDLNIFKCMWQKEFKCPHQDIDFILYTSKHLSGKVLNANNQKTLLHGGFRTDRESVFIIHGFNGTSKDTHMRYLKDAYLSRKFNVVMVNWQRLTFYPCYFSALSNMKLVGQCTAQIYAMLTYAGQFNKQITCVGHSLGAHICGMVTNHLSAKQHKIIGLDPARPLIERHGSRSYRLTRDDADFVQIIHTNAGALGQLSYSGSLDLCINGGSFQPFCRGNPIRQSRCSHFLSVCYLANAIFKHKLFPYVPCPKGCTKNVNYPFSDAGNSIIGKSNLVRLMHIGQDVPDETTGAYCVQVNFAKHCPFND